MVYQFAFTRLSESMARWRPSRDVSTSTCTRCATWQMFSYLFDELPHDLLHDFVRDVSTKFDRIVDAALHELDEAQLCDDVDWLDGFDNKEEVRESIIEDAECRVWIEVRRMIPALQARKEEVLDPLIAGFLACETLDLDSADGPEWLRAA